MNFWMVIHAKRKDTTEAIVSIIISAYPANVSEANVIERINTIV